MKEVFDYLERQPDINKMMLVVVAKGNAEELLNLSLKWKRILNLI
jgi:spore germination protein